MKQVLGWSDLRGLDIGHFMTLYPLKSSNEELSEEMNKYCVVGRIIGLSDQLQNEYETPLQGKGLESMVNSTLLANAKSGAIDSLTGTDYLKGKTLISRKESLSVFSSPTNTSKDITLEFVAHVDPFMEVDAPFLFLKKMASSQLSDGLMNAIKDGANKTMEDLLTSNSGIVGETPYKIALIQGDKRLAFTEWEISSVSCDLDKIEIDVNRNNIYRQVNVTIQPKMAVNRDEIIIF